MYKFIFLIFITNTVFANNNIYITNQTYKKNGLNFSYNYSLPKLFIKNKNLNETNMIFQNIMKISKNETMNLSKKNFNSYIKDTIKYKVFHNNFNFCSILITKNLINENEKKTTLYIFNFSPKTGIITSSNDIFTPQGLIYFKNKILNLIEKENINNNSKKFFPISEINFDINKIPFFFENNNLVFIFPKNILTYDFNGNPKFYFKKDEILNFFTFNIGG
ncbi:hypothetical protein [Cetobacterium sp. SF1]|uniref:hypothetical protein n=1 Tax=Cetobacterium sp. SF1 TaxID=3417654 RepID=UPI003CF76EC0